MPVCRYVFRQVNKNMCEWEGVSVSSFVYLFFDNDNHILS